MNFAVSEKRVFISTGKLRIVSMIEAIKNNNINHGKIFEIFIFIFSDS